VRPILVILTLPVTVVTLGLFLFVINALLVWLVAEIVPGLRVTGFGAALVGSILYSLITLVTSWLVFRK
jgi:putative membrane protein